MHNPMERCIRKNAFCFAGSYYPGFPGRCADFGHLVSAASELLPVTIYDRNFRNPSPSRAFLEEFRPLIAGSLDYGDIGVAYKGYRWGINMNTVKDSRTMFARRVFELLASNTPVVSNYSPAMRKLFGDLALASDSREDLARWMDEYRDEVRYRKLRLLGLRKVMREHTYCDRLDRVRAALGAPVKRRDTVVWLLAAAENGDDAAAAIDSFRKQAYPHARLVLTGPGAGGVGANGGIIPAGRPSAVTAALAAMDGDDLFGIFDSKSHHERHYLTDIELSMRYGGTDACGKVCRYVMDDAGSPRLMHDGAQYKTAASLPVGASLFRASALSPGVIADWTAKPEGAMFSTGSCLALDEFNYLGGGKFAPPSVFSVTDDPEMDEGVSLADLVDV